MNFSNTLNLPKTQFSMRANLPLREPSFLKFWEENDVYNLALNNRDRKKTFILHDGPPYSNGRIHLGQALNKILKDIIVKFKTMNGYYSPYVPGWDTHGLPNELQTIKTYKIDRKKVDPLYLRNKCKEYSLHFMEIQREQFKRLGVLGHWEKPYLTLDNSYEASIVRVFKEMYDKGYVYRGLKPVYWCPHCETSLADAEIEYKDKESYSIYVKFPLITDVSNLFDNQNLPVFIVIWTTTPWTLPANVAIALHPDYIYSFVKVKDEIYLVAKELLSNFIDNLQIKDYEVLYEIDGKKLENFKAKHPFLDRTSLVILEDYVTLEQGTGCVHTAPGHGMEDFIAGQDYKLDVLVPVDSVGRMKKEAGDFIEGLFYKEANDKIVDKLKENGLLLSVGTISHSYPHCWRCHNPVIFRATSQWFVNVDHNDLRKKSIDVLSDINWYPSWGHERMEKMLTFRPDWCLSRQRTWGVPIPVFYCKNCGQVVSKKEHIEKVEKLIEQEGSDVWYKLEPEDILGKDFVCPHCGLKEFKKEMDIFDVWFESGVSHRAVLEPREELSWPSNIYLEGNDQYRGWFQVSLLTSMATKQQPPYKEVITHGWVLDEKGRTMHKSLGNVIDPMEVIKKYGADILRLFLSSIEFKNDIKVGDNLLKQTGDNYRKIRNTMRFLLGNLYDFDKNMIVKYKDLLEIDKWALSRLQQLKEDITSFYNKYEFHKVYKYLVNFCSVDMSSFYLDILKDRLYTYKKDSIERRAAQTVLYYIVKDLVVLIYPILSFTAEDVWQYIPNKEHISVHLADWPQVIKEFRDFDLEKKWSDIIDLREKIYLHLEQAKLNKIIKQPLEARLTLYIQKDKEKEYLLISKEELKTILIVSQLEIVFFDKKEQLPDLDSLNQVDVGLYLYIQKAKGKKCARCWNYFEKMSDYNENLCDRCAKIVKELEFSVS